MTTHREITGRVLDVVQLARARTLSANGEGRRIRVNKDLSLQEIADAVGVSLTTVQRWEVGTRRPTGAPALRWVDLLTRLAADCERS